MKGGSYILNEGNLVLIHRTSPIGDIKIIEDVVESVYTKPKKNLTSKKKVLKDGKANK
jgi:hypothetical protein